MMGLMVIQITTEEKEYIQITKHSRLILFTIDYSPGWRSTPILRLIAGETMRYSSRGGADAVIQLMGHERQVNKKTTTKIENIINTKFDSIYYI